MVDYCTAYSAPPWHDHWAKVRSLLYYDPEVVVRDVVERGEREYVIPILVNSAVKASALKTILRSGVSLAGVRIALEVLGPHGVAGGVQGVESGRLLNDAFSNNPLYCGTKRVLYSDSFEFTYCVFVREAVQIQTDDLSRYRNISTFLVEDIARMVLAELPGVSFCTEVVDPIPL